jgi:Peptidase family M28
MKIRKKFLQLTKLTYPYGTEKFLETFLPSGFQIDKYGNYYLSIGDNYSTMFTCHLDTSCKNMEMVKHEFFGNYVMTDGTTILGADDKAGMIVVLYMIEKKIPGLYYFFIGEEVGCVGSSDLANAFENKKDYPQELDNIKKVVSFDRRGTSSVITDQFYGVCCSNDFATALCQELNGANEGLFMRMDDTGVLTDSAQFMGIIPECTNISVGYYDEHTVKEKQDIDHLYRLCKSVVKVDWESLPVVREPQSYTYYGSEDYLWGGGWEGWDESPVDRSPVLDSEYCRENYTFVKTESGERKIGYISQTWINHEKLLIADMFKKQGRNIEEIDWDGTSLWVIDGESHQKEYVGSRSDLVEFIDNITIIPVAHLKYSL